NTLNVECNVFIESEGLNRHRLTAPYRGGHCLRGGAQHVRLRVAEAFIENCGAHMQILPACIELRRLELMDDLCLQHALSSQLRDLEEISGTDSEHELDFARGH